MSIIRGYLVQFWIGLCRAPFPLRAYLVFTVLATALSFVPMFYKPLSAAMVPYTGWLGLFYYAFTLWFVIAAMSNPHQRRVVYAMLPLLGLAIVFGGMEAFQHIHGPDAIRQLSGNPYLVIHPYRPIITVALPTFWLLLLVSPTMIRWIHGAKRDDADLRRQFSLADLLYFVVPVAVAMALSVGLVPMMRKADAQLAPPAAAAVATPLSATK